MDAAVAEFGRIDAHHLNAGIFGSFAELPDLPADEFDRVLAVNVRGQFLGLRAAFRRYREQRSTGAVVVTASIASLTGSADLLPYMTSKHAVVGLIRGAAVYGGPLGIRVNGVAPGIVPTDLFAAAAAATGGKNDMARRASTTPLRRAGTAEEIAAVAAFLLVRRRGVRDGPGRVRGRRRDGGQHGAALRRRRRLGHRRARRAASTADWQEGERQ